MPLSSVFFLAGSCYFLLLLVAFVQLVYKEPDARPEVYRQYSASMHERPAQS